MDLVQAPYEYERCLYIYIKSVGYLKYFHTCTLQYYIIFIIIYYIVPYLLYLHSIEGCILFVLCSSLSDYYRDLLNPIERTNIK